MKKQKGKVIPGTAPQPPRPEKKPAGHRLPSPSFMLRHRRLLEFVAIATLCMIVYGNTIGNGYNLDDAYVVSIDAANTQTRQGIAAIPEILSSKYSEGPGVTYGYRPLSKITLAIEYSLWQNKPGASHFINILLFAINCYLLLIFIRQLGRLLGHTDKYAFYLPVLLYVVHPIHTEVVCSIKNREEILCFLFMLAALLSFLRFLGSSGKTRFAWASAIAVFALLSLLSKQTGFNLFGIMVLVLAMRHMAREHTPVLPENKTRRIHTLAVVSILLIVLLCMWLLLRFVPQQLGQDNMVTKFETDPYHFSPPGHSFPNFVQTLWFYVQKLVIPFPLLFYYGFDMLPDRGWDSPYPYVGLAACLAVLFLLYYLVYRRRAYFTAFWVVFFFLTMLPFSNPGILFFNVVGIVGERLVYQASAAYCVLLAVFLTILGNWIKRRYYAASMVGTGRLMWALATAVALVYALLTINRNTQWKDMMTLYAHDIRWLDRSVRANFMYGSQLMREYEQQRAASKANREWVLLAQHHFQRALQLYPKYDDALLAMGTLYGGYYGKPDSAVYYLERVDTLNLHNYIKARERLGDVFYYKKQPDRALAFYRQAYDKYPDNYPLYAKLNDLLMAQGRTAEAIDLGLRAMAYKWPPVYLNLGDAYREQEDQIQAVRYYELALRNGVKSRRAADFVEAYYRLTTGSSVIMPAPDRKP